MSTRVTDHSHQVEISFLGIFISDSIKQLKNKQRKQLNLHLKLSEWGKWNTGDILNHCASHCDTYSLLQNCNISSILQTLMSQNQNKMVNCLQLMGFKLDGFVILCQGSWCLLWWSDLEITWYWPPVLIWLLKRKLRSNRGEYGKRWLTLASHTCKQPCGI